MFTLYFLPIYMYKAHSISHLYISLHKIGCRFNPRSVISVVVRVHQGSSRCMVTYLHDLELPPLFSQGYLCQKGVDLWLYSR